MAKFSDVFSQKDLLSLDTLSVELINNLLARTSIIKSTYVSGGKLDILKGKTVGLLFFEPSTRTKLSFEKAIVELGGKALHLDVSFSSLVKGENLVDTVRNVVSLGVDALVIRHSASGSVSQLAKEVSVPVINAGDGCHQHPTQALLDLFTVWEKRKGLVGLKWLFWGDIYFSRVFRSHLSVAKRLGIDIMVGGPPTLMPAGFKGLKHVAKLEEALPFLDVLYLLRVQTERQKTGYFPSLKEYANLYGLNSSRLSSLKKDGLVMHPGPVNIGVEVNKDVLSHENILIGRQVENGVFLRMAVLDLFLGGE